MLRERKNWACDRESSNFLNRRKNDSNYGRVSDSRCLPPCLLASLSAIGNEHSIVLCDLKPCAFIGPERQRGSPS